MSYQRLSLKEKRELDLSRVREPSVSCLMCDAQVMVEDMLRHLDERCPGLREPSGAARWLPRVEALKLGVSSSTLYYWASNGQVRFRGGVLDRLFSLRDLTLMIMARRIRQRRISK